MGSKSFKNSPWKCVFLAAAAVVIATVSPSASAQTAAMSTSSPALEALPAALSAAPRAAAAAAAPAQPAAAPAPAIVVNDNFKPYRPVSVHDHLRRNWLLLAAASSAAASLDAYTTRRAIQSGAVEMNPILRPFVNSNGLYAAIQISPVVMDLVGYKMQHSENRLFRHTWWIPQAMGTGVSFSAAAHNFGNIK
jgi:hypothetical protein